MSAVTRRDKMIAWAPAAAYMALIFVLSSMSISIPRIEDVPFRDKGVHFVEYGVLGILVLRAAFRTWPDRASWRLIAFAILFTIGFGVSDELHQVFVPTRSADVKDLLADAIGASIGAGVCALASRMRRARAER